ncbi:hypothetical protein J3A69_006293 [Pseudomonas putida]|nr:hypothetical protein [Pseudomonas sp. PvP089]MBP2092612.1 hypothetical protein [Pseudomonas sp. PvP088]MBP2226570.1 hypothetical protein [Pseudomonas putida]
MAQGATWFVATVLIPKKPINTLRVGIGRTEMPTLVIATQSYASDHTPSLAIPSKPIHNTYA